MSEFEDTLLDMLGEMEMYGVDLTQEKMSVSLVVKDRPDIVFTIIMEKTEEFDKQNAMGLH